MTSSLKADHEPEAIRLRLASKKSFSYLSDAVLGAIDGCVTTFAVVMGVLGGGLSSGVALLLGFANLLADGFSMAVSNFESRKSSREIVERTRRMEEEHIRRVPEGEKEEIRQIYAKKGFEEPLLTQVVEVITKDPRRWVDSMITEEYGLALEGPQPLFSALTTFLAFLLVGSLPLLPFLFNRETLPHGTYVYSSVLTLGAFFSVGMLKGHLLEKSRLRTGLRTALLGGAAAFLAFLIGYGLREFAGQRM